ncbi:MAG: outer membrane protein [Candidatus Phaeomarinobacter sp.]
MKTTHSTFKRAAHASAIAAVASLASTAALAEEGANDWYLSLNGGASIHTDDVEFTNGTNTVETDFDTGFTFGGAVGYRWNDYNFGGFVPRTELEVSYTENDADTIDFSGNGVGNELVADGSQISSVGIYGNLFFDLPNVISRDITPYIGGGAGLNIVNHNLIYGAGGLNLNDDGDTVFAWHVTGGVSYALSEELSTFVDVGFRQAVDAGSVRRRGSTTLTGAAGGNFEDDINAIVVRSGLSVDF